MANKIVKTTAINVTQILFSTEPMFSTSVVVGNTGVTADANGKKILKAGTPMAGNFEARTTAFVKAGDATVNCILLHDVDVTAGNENAEVLINGAVNTSRVDAATKALYVDAVKTALKGSIYFMA